MIGDVHKNYISTDARNKNYPHVSDFRSVNAKKDLCKHLSYPRHFTIKILT